MSDLSALVDPAKTAVLVVDVQNDYCDPQGAIARGGASTAAAIAMIPTLQKLLSAARRTGTKVVFVQTNHADETDSEAWRGRSKGRYLEICRTGTWGAESIGVSPQPGEPVVVKHRYSGFVNTRLDSILRSCKIENLIMTGVSTNVCVESTARHGFMLDYNIVFLSDCTAAFTQTEHDMALYNIGKYFGTVTTADAVIESWTEAALTRSLPR